MQVRLIALERVAAQEALGALHQEAARVLALPARVRGRA